MTTISDLPVDLVEEVLSRVPVKCLRAVRFTCTKWSTLSNHQSFTKKQIAQAKKKQMKESLVIMTMNSRAYLMSVNLHGIHEDDNVESSIQRKGTLISLTDGDRVVQYNILHCEGLLFCITRDCSRLVVWNPYCGQTRWIEPRNAFHKRDSYGLGYEMKNNSHRCHKILRYLDARDEEGVGHRIYEFEIYNFDSSSWKVVEVTPDWKICYYQRGVSLKGNTYWNARDYNIPQGEGHNIHQDEGEMDEETPEFLICFDFTTERFGPRLPLPFHAGCQDTVSLSSVREEQLAVLFQNWVYRGTEIWISNKIEPNEVSWNKFFLRFQVRELPSTAASFLVDEENKVAVIYSIKFRYGFDKGEPIFKHIANTAYFIGEEGYSKEVDLGEPDHSFPQVCSFVPSSVQIKESAPRSKRKRDQIITYSIHKT